MRSWKTTAAGILAIVATPDSLVMALSRFVAEGLVHKHGLAQALLSQLRNAERAYSEGRCRNAARLYRAFSRTVSAQQGKGIDALVAAPILSGDALDLADSCGVPGGARRAMRRRG